MKQTSKRLLSLIMALAMILSLMPVIALAADTTLYLDPGCWNVDGARFAIYSWGSATTWTDMTDSDGDGIYSGVLPSGNTNVIFCRMNPSSSTNSWSYKWNQTNDLIYDGTNNLYTISDWGSDKSPGSWSVIAVEEETQPSETETSTTETEPAIEREVILHYRNTGAWADVNLYTWEPEIAPWPGVVMTAETDHENWYTYTLTVPYSTQSLLFNSTAGAKTTDLTLTNIPEAGDEYWYDDATSTGFLTEAPESYDNGAVASWDVVIHYRNTNSWDAPYIYGWDGTAILFGSWPGTAMTAEEEHSGWYTYTYSTTLTAFELLFTNSDGSLKTSDLAIASIPETGIEVWYDTITSASFLTEAPDSWTNTDVVTRNVTLHFQDSNSWKSVYAYACDSSWNYHGNPWPGAQMVAEAGYPGWYTVTIESFAGSSMNLIINNNNEINNPAQTADLSISNIPETDCEYWFVPSEEGWWTGSFATDAPETYVKEETGICDVTLHFKNTLGWEAVNGYAWTNTWPATYPIEAWPGTALTADENGWYTVSFSAVYPLTDTAVYAIFNYVTDAATVQTADLYIDCTDKTEVEKWIIPTGVQNDYLSYECDIYDAEPVETAQVNGVTYYTVADAIANANGGVIKLVNDSVVALEIAADVTIDLAGYKLDEVTVTDGYSLTLIDTAGDDYTSASCGVAYVKGTVNAFGGADGKNYLTILNSDGQYISHRYDVALTHISLDPANDALGYKAELYGDETVQQYVTGFGFNLGVDGGVTKSYSKTGTQNLTLRLKNIMAVGGGEMNINASAFVTLTVGEESNTQTCDTQTTTMKETLQAVDAAWETAGYTEEQKTAVQALCTQYYDDMTDWNLTNIFPTIEIPIE